MQIETQHNLQHQLYCKETVLFKVDQLKAVNAHCTQVTITSLPSHTQNVPLSQHFPTLRVALM